MLDSEYHAPTSPTQDPRPDTPGPDTGGGEPPIPYQVRLRFMTKRDLDRAMDYWDRKSQDALRMRDDEAFAIAERRISMIWGEFDYRDAKKAARERHRQARIRTAAAIFRETGQV